MFLNETVVRGKSRDNVLLIKGMSSIPRVPLKDAVGWKGSQWGAHDET